MKIEIHSLNSIENRAKEPFLPHTSLISIGDPDAPPPKLINKPNHVLRLVFDDITPEDAVERLELLPSILKREKVLHLLLRNFNTYLFTDEMADKIVNFIMDNAKETDVLICQCEHGQSRSAAVAAAVAELFGRQREVIFKDERCSPNPFVYRKLLGALRKEKGTIHFEYRGKQGTNLFLQ